MVAASQFNLVDGFSIDYLHFGLLGILKKLMDLWLSPCNHAKPYYITKAKQDALNKRILSIKPVSEITRRPRSIFDRADYKGNEYRSLLLYYLRYCLVDLLPMKYINHFQLLSSSIYMLLGRNITPETRSLAETRLNRFADEYELLYGKDNVTMNIHLCRHAASSVDNVGPLWAQSAFGFETNNGVLVRSNKAKRDYLHQISWKYITSLTLQNDNNDRKNIKGIDIGGKFVITKSDEIAKFFGIDTVTAYTFITIGDVKYTSIKYKHIATIDYFIRLKSNELGAVNFYAVENFKIHAYIDVYKIVESCDHLITVKKDGNRIIDINDISEKMIYFKINNEEIVTSMPNHFEKT